MTLVGAMRSAGWPKLTLAQTPQSVEPEGEGDTASDEHETELDRVKGKQKSIL